MPLLERLGRLLRRAREPFRSTPLQIALLALGISGFAVGVVLSWNALALGAEEIDLSQLLLAAILGIALVPLNVAEYRLTAELARAPISRRTALSVTVFASMANLLPIPAGLAVRFRGLVRSGASSSRAIGSAVLVSLVWFTMTALIGGLGLTLLGRTRLGLAAIALSIGCAVLALVSFRAVSHPRVLWFFFRVVVVESAFVVQAALRIGLVLSALSVTVLPSQAAVLASSGALAAAVGVIPGSIGVWEGVTAALSPIVAVEPEAGFLATAVLRVLTIPILGAAAVGVWWVRLRDGARPQE